MLVRADARGKAGLQLAQVREVWASVLGHQNFDNEANFFEVWLSLMPEKHVVLHKVDTWGHGEEGMTRAGMAWLGMVSLGHSPSRVGATACSP